MIDLQLSNGKKLDIEYPIILRDKDGNIVYTQWLNGDWTKREYTNGKCTYWENSFGDWQKIEYTNGKRTYWESSNGTKHGTPKSDKKQAILNQIEELKKEAEAL